MQFDHAKVSLAGNRQENQDRVEIFAFPEAALLVVVDGMGGHAEGAKAAEVTVSTLRECFTEQGRPVLDPQGFLTISLAQAHARVVALGDGVALDFKPRATCAVCLVQDAAAYWAHVGDSRIYQLREGAVRERTRDHSHVELLLREGLIAEREMKSHPMRNFVECCLGGDTPLPNMSITAPKRLKAGDVLLACTDGLWTGVDDGEIAQISADGALPLDAALRDLADTAVGRNNPHSDNTTAAALRWRGAAR
ncbi:MAG TPA: protein phosphatase 2C domain-containing protein [Gammaproteobacteria bacterium]|nr:protein phosphatase 2C domain-containing protein [Gammaproteobacteria bacterium]